jgi:hypothetical protein
MSYRLHVVNVKGPCVLSISNAMLKNVTWPYPGEVKMFLCLHHKTYGEAVGTGQHNFNLSTGWR